MGPDKDMPNNSFIVRVTFGSFLLAALITIVGLTWIFALGFIVGRMYPAENKEIQQASIHEPPPRTAEAHNPVPVESTKYHAIIREENFDEQTTTQGTQASNINSAPRLATVKNTAQAPKSQPSKESKQEQAPVISEEKREEQSSPPVVSVAQKSEAQVATNKENPPTQIVNNSQPEITAQAPSSHEQSATSNSEDKANTTVLEKDKVEQEAPLFSYTYQIASIPDLQKAKDLQSQLEKGGLQTYFEEHQAGSQTWHRLLMRFESHESDIPAFKENLQKFDIKSVLLRSKKNIQ